MQNELEMLKGILNNADEQWKVIYSDIKDLKKEFKDISNRKTDIEELPDVEDFNEDQFVVREPLTIILSEQGWVRTQKNHLDGDVELKYREGDKEKFRIHALTTDKIIFFADNGRFFSVPANKLPSGRGFGEPVSLTIDVKGDNKIISCFPFFEGSVILASESGHGFKIKTTNLVAQTKSGKQIINVKNNNKAKICKKITGDTIAIVGNNRKLITYSIEEVPELNKGKGVILQRYKDGTLSDIITFKKEDGISWKMNGGRQRTEKFERCEVKLIQPKGKDAEYDSDGHPLPKFHIRMWNGRTQVGLIVNAVGRAHWSFNQPTRAHMTSHFTYNEYPLKVEQITVLDEKGVRTLDDWDWVHGNAEHSWGILH